MAKKKQSKRGKKQKRYKLTKPVKLLRALAWIGAIVLLVLLFRWSREEGLLDLEGLAEDAKEAIAQTGDGTAPRGTTIEHIKVDGLTPAEAVAKVKQAEVETLKSIRITVDAGQKQLVLDADDIGAKSNLEEVAQKAAYATASAGYTLEYTADSDKIAAALEALRADIDVPPTEPYAVPSLDETFTQHFEIYAGKSGTRLNAQAMAEEILRRLKNREFQFALEPITEPVPPGMSVEQVKQNTRRISTFTTRFRNSTSNQIIKNRVYNITKAADIINCCTVQPGEEWSFNNYVGLRTAEGGWKEANGISGGKEYTLQVGGGICQVSTTLYNALLRGNIKITDRRAHSIPSDYVEKGLDATVDSGGIDLKFVNDTGFPMYIFCYIKPDPEDNRYATITVSLYGKPLEEGVTYQPRSEVVETIPRDTPKYIYDPSIPQGYQLETVVRHDGYVAEVYLDKYVNGELVSSEFLYRDKYRGNVAEISIGTGDPATTKVPEGAVPVENAPAQAPNQDGSVG